MWKRIFDMLKNTCESRRLYHWRQKGASGGNYFEGNEHMMVRRKYTNSTVLLCLLVLMIVRSAESFTQDCSTVLATFAAAKGKTIFASWHLNMIGRSDSNDKEEDEVEEEDLVIGNVPGVTIDGLNWRVTRLKLEEENTKRFLKSKPRYLPYNECRKWVIAMGRWDTEQEWKEWIDMGEKRNAYIPARPDEYYEQLGKWKNWEHFLGKIDDDDFLGEWE